MAIKYLRKSARSLETSEVQIFFKKMRFYFMLSELLPSRKQLTENNCEDG